MHSVHACRQLSKRARAHGGGGWNSRSCSSCCELLALRSLRAPLREVRRELGDHLVDLTVRAFGHVVSSLLLICDHLPQYFRRPFQSLDAFTLLAHASFDVGYHHRLERAGQIVHLLLERLVRLQYGRFCNGALSAKLLLELGYRFSDTGFELRAQLAQPLLCMARALTAALIQSRTELLH